MKRKLSHIALSVVVLFLFSPVINAEWVQTNGPEGGEITKLAVSGVNVFAGTFYNGVFLYIYRRTGL